MPLNPNKQFALCGDHKTCPLEPIEAKGAASAERETDKHLHLVIQDVHRVLVVAPDDQMAVPLDVAPCGVQVSAHQF